MEKLRNREESERLCRGRTFSSVLGSLLFPSCCSLASRVGQPQRGLFSARVSLVSTGALKFPWKKAQRIFSEAQRHEFSMLLLPVIVKACLLMFWDQGWKPAPALLFSCSILRPFCLAAPELPFPKTIPSQLILTYFFFLTSTLLCCICSLLSDPWSPWRESQPNSIITILKNQTHWACSNDYATDVKQWSRNQGPQEDFVLIAGFWFCLFFGFWFFMVRFHRFRDFPFPLPISLLPLYFIPCYTIV